MLSTWIGCNDSQQKAQWSFIQHVITSHDSVVLQVFHAKHLLQLAVLVCLSPKFHQSVFVTRHFHLAKLWVLDFWVFIFTALSIAVRSWLFALRCSSRDSLKMWNNVTATTCVALTPPPLPRFNVTLSTNLCTSVYAPSVKSVGLVGLSWRPWGKWMLPEKGTWRFRGEAHGVKLKQERSKWWDRLLHCCISRS